MTLAVSGRFDFHPVALAARLPVAAGSGGASPSANPGRDMRLAYAQGWLAPVVDHCVRLTEAGWQLRSQMLSLGGDADAEAAGAPVPV